jgi:hypothetical protein
MRRIILIVVVIVIAVGGWYAYKEFNRKNADLTEETPAFSVPAAALIQSFSTDTATAARKYTDKVIEVSGRVKQVANEENHVVLALGEPGEMSSVQCSMDSKYRGEYATVKEGQLVTVKGICTGGKTEELFGTDVFLNRCVISKR